MATASTRASAPPNAINAPRYVGASTTTVSPGSTSAWHASAMHSIPPLVTISSSRCGRGPCLCSWRSHRYSRTLGRPSHGVYCSATAGSSRTRRETISSSTPVGNVFGLGKPPVIDRTPGGLPARIAVSSAPPRACARRANSICIGTHPELQSAGFVAVQRRDLLGPVGEGGQRPALAHRGEHRAFGAPDRLRGLQRGRQALGRRDHHAVVV